MILEHIITDTEDGSELLTVLKKSLALSATAIRRLKRSDGIKMDGKTVFTNYTVSRGEKLFVTLNDAPSDIIPEKGEIEIRYEDEGLLAVNKAPGILVHPSRARNTGTLSNFVLDYLLSGGGGGGGVEGTSCHTVGRLDRDTSGVVLFAKNSHMKNLAVKSLKKPESKKEYLALVCGVPKETEGVIDMPIRRLRERDMLRVVSPDGDKAETHYKVESFGTINGRDVTLLRFRLMTGRTHQIRVHCHWSGFPIIGDCLYFTPFSRKLSEAIGAGGQMLHCELLEFIHPMKGELLQIKAPVITPLMTEVLNLLLQ